MNNSENDNLLDHSAENNGKVVANAQYVKDLSFENPNAPMSLTIKTQPKVDLNLDLESKKLQDSTYEVSMLIKAEVKLEDEVVFLLDLTYAGVFSLENIPEDQVEPILFVHCPTILFPFARRVVADTTRDGGFLPLMIDPIDFFSLYQSKKSTAMN